MRLVWGVYSKRRSLGAYAIQQRAAESCCPPGLVLLGFRVTYVPRKSRVSVKTPPCV